VQCPRCGLLYSSFKETGRLGCSECYSAFQFQLRPLLRRIHGDTRHRGKAPARGAGVVTSTRQIQRLHDDLQRAVEREDFEKAASLRDEIRRLEAERQAPTPGDRP
jgi:protein arginine kinase activator